MSELEEIQCYWDEEEIEQLLGGECSFMGCADPRCCSWWDYVTKCILKDGRKATLCEEHLEIAEKKGLLAEQVVNEIKVLAKDQLLYHEVYSLEELETYTREGWKHFDTCKYVGGGIGYLLNKNLEV